MTYKLFGLLFLFVTAVGCKQKVMVKDLSKSQRAELTQLLLDSLSQKPIELTMYGDYCFVARRLAYNEVRNDEQKTFFARLPRAVQCNEEMKNVGGVALLKKVTIKADEFSPLTYPVLLMRAEANIGTQMVVARSLTIEDGRLIEVDFSIYPQTRGVDPVFPYNRLELKRNGNHTMVLAPEYKTSEPFVMTQGSVQLEKLFLSVDDRIGREMPFDSMAKVQ